MLFIIAGSALAAILLVFIYHQMVHATVEDFTGQPIAEARTWAQENDVEIELEQTYSTEYASNQVVSQSVNEGDKIRVDPSEGRYIERAK